MRRVPLILACLLSCLAATKSYSVPAGKCRDDIVGIPFDFQAVASVPDWTIFYTTDNELFQNTDGESRKIKPIGSGKFKVEDSVVGNDKSKQVAEYNVTYSDNVVTEITTDEKGNVVVFYDYILAITEVFEMLYYRCSPIGKGNKDTRYIKARAGTTISDDVLNWLFAVDAKYNFKGKLHKMPNKNA